MGKAGAERLTSEDALLDRFMPAYEVAERHHVHVAAPAAITFAAAKDQDLLHSLPVRTIVRIREIALGAAPDRRRASSDPVSRDAGHGLGRARGGSGP